MRYAPRLLLTIPALCLAFAQQYVVAAIFAILLVSYEVWIFRLRKKAKYSEGFAKLAAQRGVPRKIAAALRRGRFEATVGKPGAEALERVAQQARRAVAPIFEMRFHRAGEAKQLEEPLAELSHAQGNILGESFLAIEPALTTGVPVSDGVLARLKRNEESLRLLTDEAVRLTSLAPQAEDPKDEELLARLGALREVEAHQQHVSSEIPEFRPDSTETGYPNLARSLDLLYKRGRRQQWKTVFTWDYFLNLAIIMVAIWFLRDPRLYIGVIVASGLIIGWLKGNFSTKGGQEALRTAIRDNSWKNFRRELAKGRLASKLGEQGASDLDQCAFLMQKALGAAAELTVLTKKPSEWRLDAQKQISAAAIEQFKQCLIVLHPSLMAGTRAEPSTLKRLEHAHARLELLAIEATALAASINHPDFGESSSILERVRALREIEADQVGEAEHASESTGAQL